MKQLMENWRGFLNEEVYGGNAVVYHGTDSIEDVKSIMRNGYSLSKNRAAMYGKGLYTVYELEDTNTGEGHYGDVILKFRVEAQPGRFLVLDIKPNRDIFGEYLSLAEQAELYDLNLPTDILQEHAEMIEKYGEEAFTSDVAKKVVSHFGGRGSLIEEIDGLFFTGRQDGPVCVVYNPDKSDLIAWKKVEEGQKVTLSSEAIDSYIDNSVRESLKEADRLNKIASRLNEPLNSMLLDSYKPAFRFCRELEEEYDKDILGNVEEDSYGKFGAGVTLTDGSELSELFYEDICGGVEELQQKQFTRLSKIDSDKIENNVESLREKVISLHKSYEEDMHNLVGFIKMRTYNGVVFVEWESSGRTGGIRDEERWLVAVDEDNYKWKQVVDGEDIFDYLKKRKEKEFSSPELPS